MTLDGTRFRGGPAERPLRSAFRLKRREYTKKTAGVAWVDAGADTEAVLELTLALLLYLPGPFPFGVVPCQLSLHLLGHP